MSLRALTPYVLGAIALLPVPAGAELQPPLPVPEAPPRDRPGRFRLGPFYLTPLLRLGNVGLDTNVFYTPEARQTDVSVNGGPGLRVVLPIQENLRFVVDGGANYHYFVRTESQRRLVYDVQSGLLWRGVRTDLALRGAYVETFNRPALEIERRVAQVETRGGGELRRRLFGRTRLVVGGEFSRLEVERGQEYLGADLRTTLSRDLVSGYGGLEYSLTPKTRLELLGTLEDYSYLFDSTRDTRHGLATFGIRTESTTFLSGYVVLGAERHESANVAGREPITFYGHVNVAWHLNPRLVVGGVYLRDLYQTALVTPQGLPIGLREMVGANLQLEFVRHVFLRLTGTRIDYVTQSPVRIETSRGEVIEGVQKEKVYEASAELTYQLKSRLRVGGTLVYSERQKSFTDLGVDGLLLGATVIFTP